jgi:EAL domain-containing protein (putative c-di-GMP-specific phosphodiesterase class I)
MSTDNAAGTDRGLDEELYRLLGFASTEVGVPVTFEAHEHRNGHPVAGAVLVRGARTLHGELQVAGSAPLAAHASRFLGAIARLVADRLDRDLEQAELARARTERVRWVLDADALRVAFQPILDLRSGAAVGVEALSRFPDGERPPEQWFREAAAVGLGPDLELRAIAAAVEAFDALPAEVYLSVNVSPAVAALPELGRQLRRVPVDRLVFEITEHDEVTDYDELNDTLRPLRRRGLRLAVDDAGAGFASLRHILRMHPDIIKLDMSLIRDIDRDAVLRALSCSITSFGSAVQASVVAEGIESRGELDTLRSLGVAFGQGYLLQRPAAIGDLDLGRVRRGAPLLSPDEQRTCARSAR